jgi:DNA-directed RNA polymerase subunit omega
VGRFDFLSDLARLPRLGCRYRLPKLIFLEVPLARVTVEDCLERVGNRFALVILAAERARQLANGGRPLIACSNKPAVTSLREIAKGTVHFNESVEGTVRQYLDEVKSRGARPEKSR